jgi:hypothetical protein
MERKCVYCEVGNEVFFTKEQKFSLSTPQRHIGGNSGRVLYINNGERINFTLRPFYSQERFSVPAD